MQAVRLALDKHVSNFSALSACPLLENIDADNALIISMTAFTGMQNLKHLYIRQTTVESLSGIEGFPISNKLAWQRSGRRPDAAFEPVAT